MKTKNLNQKSGISLIVLVITIIVIIILAVAVILGIANNNPVENAKEARIKNDVKAMQEELEVIKSSNYAKNNGKDYKNSNGEEITIYDLTTSEGYRDKFIVEEGKLKLVSNKATEKEKEEVTKIGIEITKLSQEQLVANAYEEWEKKTEEEKIDFADYIKEKMQENNETIDVPEDIGKDEDKIKEWVTENYIINDVVKEGYLCTSIEKEIYITGLDKAEKRVSNIFIEKGYTVYDLNSDVVEKDKPIGTGYIIKKGESKVGTILLYWDVNEDGIVDSFDAALILRYKSSDFSPTFIQKLAMDVNHDGKITQDDSTLIREYKVGLSQMNQNVKVPANRNY